MRLKTAILSASFAILSAVTVSAQNSTPRNLILFVPDGLRGRIVTPETAPAMAAVRDKGVNFKNPHSLFPTFTTANASAMATGHYLGDTGDFSNTIYTGYPVEHANGSVTPFLEVDPVILDVDEHFGGDYLNEETVLKMARAKGYSTAAMGKLGPTLIFDHTDKVGADGLHSIVIDDATGGKNGMPLSQEMQAALTKANLPLATPPRGDNGKAGDAKTPGTTVPNIAQQAYFADVATKVVLPMFKERAKPFVLVFWSRDPDGSQHNTGDSLNTVTPGINGPTSLAGKRSTILASLPTPTSSSPPITASRRFQRKARPVLRRKSPMRTRRKISCRWVFSRSISQKRLTCRCSIRTTRTRAWPTTPIPRLVTACSATIPPSRNWWLPPTADRT